MEAAPHATPARWLEFDEIDSTNAEAMRLALAGERGPLYIRADRQTAGKGRSGRVWEMPAGNLAMSRVGRLDCPPAVVPQLSLVAGIAVWRAAAWALDGLDVRARLHLKWPNDLLLDGAKVAGILVEATMIGPDRIAVIGIGLNTTHAPQVEGRSTAALAQVATRMGSPNVVGALVARHLEEALALWDCGRGFAGIRAAWLEAALPAGTRLAINTGRGSSAGAFAGLDSSGALLLDVDGGERQTYSFGDVALIAG